MTANTETEIFACSGCGAPITTFWAANGGGLIRGDYVLMGDTIWHNPCADRLIAKEPWTEKDGEEHYEC